jgi:cyclophilin family peptidyl-prolyl cis-trans isomerase
LLCLGGDPTGTGRGGASIYGRTFDDEIHPDLKHTGKKPMKSDHQNIRCQKFETFLILDMICFQFLNAQD